MTTQVHPLGGSEGECINKKVHVKNFSRKDLEMVCHTPPLKKKAQKPGEVPLPIFIEIPFMKKENFEMGLD